MTQRETFWEFLDRIAGAPRDDVERPIPAANPKGCIPMQRFSQRLGLTAANRAHIAGCERCQRALAAAWRVRCPGLRELRPYSQKESGYPLSQVMNRHLLHCRRCAIVARLLQLGSIVMSFPGGVAQAIAPMALAGSWASTTGQDLGLAVMNLTIEGSQPVEVLVQVGGETVRIHGTSSALDLVGKQLRVDIWDESSCATYGIPFISLENKAVARADGPISGLRAQSFSRQGVAVACVEDPPELE